MNSESKSRKKTLRNREVIIKRGSVTKAKKQIGKEENLRDKKKIKKRISTNSSSEEPPVHKNSENSEIDFGDLVETTRKRERSSTPSIQERSSEELISFNANIEKSPVTKNCYAGHDFGQQMGAPSFRERPALEDPPIQLVFSETTEKNDRIDETKSTGNIDEIMMDHEHELSSIRSNSPVAQNQCENFETDASNNESEFMENLWMKEVRKNISTLYGAYHALAHDVKDIKKLMMKNNRSVSPCSDVSSIDEDQKFSLLPKFHLKKLKRVVEMESNINSNREYKKQLIKKFATFGGSSIKNSVINIFDGIFTKKLKTKLCWKGTPEKTAFRKFTGLRDVLRQAVQARFKCNRHDIDKECKLRFNQAQKDYDREKERKSNSYQLKDD